MNEEDLKWRPCGDCGEKIIPRGIEWPMWVGGKCICGNCWMKRCLESTTAPRHDFDGPRFDHKIERDTVRENLDLKYPEKEFPGWLRVIRLLLIDALDALDRKDAISVRQQVLEFHRKFDQPIGGEPKVPNAERIRLRLRLISEEFFELLEAAGLHGGMAKDRVRDYIDEAGETFEVNLPDFADAMADLDYVVTGTAIEFGIDMGPIAAEVHRANLSKTGGGKREDGKVGKPPGWMAPDIEGKLREQGWKK